MKKKISMTKLKTKMKSKSGESIVEALMGVLIVSICMAALVTAIVTAAKINRQVKSTDISFKYSREESGTPDTVVIKDSFEEVEIKVEMFEDANGNGYYYYTRLKTDE